jgi:glycosyltransferase involved in cell wall biosynthesis
MLTSLYGRIARSLPTSVKRVLKSMMLVHAAPTETLPTPPSPPQPSRPANKDNSAAQNEAARRLRRKAEKTQGRLERVRGDKDRALRQRDRARQNLADTRRKLARLQRDTEQPAEQWWEQRLLLAGRDQGIGLRDYAYFPGGAQNPYLRLVYSRLPEVGFDPRPLGRLDHLYRLAADSVFHLHWTRVAQLGAKTVEQAEEKTAAFLEPIEAFVGRGGTLLWSIHEPLPHDCPFPAVERKLRTRLGELAAAIHVLHDATLTEISDEYEVPAEKVFVVEHPLYSGAYETVVQRAAARKLLGLDEDDVMVLCLGAIRPYKGFDRLVAMVPDLETATGRNIRVMIAGPTMASIDLSDLYNLVEQTKGASISAEAVPDQHLHILLEAADVMALPYRAVLNSGVLMLGITFGNLCVAPSNAVTADAAESGLVELFEASSDEALLDATVEAIRRSGTPHVIDADFMSRYEPTAIAGRLAAHVAEITEPAR